MKQKILTAAKKKILYLPHAITQMSRPERMITSNEIRNAIINGEIIEEYPDDARGESYLILNTEQNRTIHVVCSPKTDYLAINYSLHSSTRTMVC